MSPPIDAARDWIANQIRTRVVGRDPAGVAAAIIDAPGPRWFAEGSAIRIVHNDSAMLIGGLGAILMQSLHPLAMAGVADHSNFREDPWGRLQRTAGFLAATTFGPAEGAERAIAVVRRVHERVVGVAGDGRPYAANDPHLLRWVHIVEVDSFLRAYRRFGATTLSNRQADDYVRDMARIATELGAGMPPYSVAELWAQIAGYRAELRGTPAAREAARFLIVDPPLPIAARPPYAMLAAAAVSLLPLWARVPLRLPVLPVTERLLVRPGGQLVIHAIRWATQPTTAGNATSQPGIRRTVRSPAVAASRRAGTVTPTSDSETNGVIHGQ